MPFEASSEALYLIFFQRNKEALSTSFVVILQTNLSYFFYFKCLVNNNKTKMDIDLFINMIFYSLYLNKEFKGIKLYSIICICSIQTYCHNKKKLADVFAYKN